MTWLEKVRAIILGNLRWSPISEAKKEEVADDLIAQMEAQPAESEKRKQPEEDVLTSRGEKLSDLRARAHAEWEAAPGWTARHNPDAMQ